MTRYLVTLILKVEVVDDDEKKAVERALNYLGLDEAWHADLREEARGTAEEYKR